MGFFDAFYVMSYTATTIGFGEIPYPFTYGQRMWVTISIYLTVIGWAYAIGSLLALLQDRAFRRALAAAALHPQGGAAARAVPADRRLRADRRAARALLRRARPAVRRPRPELPNGSTAWSWTPTTPTSPAWPPTPATPGHLAVAGLDHSSCEAVVALTDDDEANLAVAMAAALLRPELPVIARVTSRTIAERMQAFGSPSHRQPVRPVRRPPAARAAGPGVLPADDLAGERAGRRAAGPRPAAAQRPLGGLRLRAARPRADRGPARRGPRRHGRRAAPARRVEDARHGGRRRLRALGDGAGGPRPGGRVRRRHGQRHDQPVAGRRRPPQQSVAVPGGPAEPRRPARRCSRRWRSTRCSCRPRWSRTRSTPSCRTPLLWRFLQEMPAKGDAWAAGSSTGSPRCAASTCRRCGRSGSRRRRRRRSARWLASGDARLGDLLRNPEDRDEPLHAVVLLVLRGRRGDAGAGRRLRPGAPATSSCWPAGRPPAARSTRSSWSTASSSTSSPAGGCRRAGSGGS